MSRLTDLIAQAKTKDSQLGADLECEFNLLSSRLEEHLQDEEKFFPTIFARAPVGIAQIGPNGQWLLANDWFCKFLGYSQTELRGRTFLEITHSDDREASLAAVRRLLTGEMSLWLKEKRYVRKDGVTLWGRLYLSLVRGQHEQPQYFIAVVEDITKEKLTKQRLHDREVQLKDAQRLAEIGSWERYRDSNSIDWSDEMLRIFGLSQPPPTLAGYLRQVHPRDREKVLGSIDQVNSSSAPVELSYRIVRPDGEVRFVRTIVQGIKTKEALLFAPSGPSRTLQTRSRRPSFCRKAKSV